MLVRIGGKDAALPDTRCQTPACGPVGGYSVNYRQRDTEEVKSQYVEWKVRSFNIQTDPYGNIILVTCSSSSMRHSSALLIIYYDSEIICRKELEKSV